MRQVVVLAAALACAGCVTNGGNNQTAAEVPSDYREQIAQQKATLFKDPGSVRDAKIGHPTPNMMGWQACIQANAKNSFGGYTGLKQYTVQLYRNGSPPLLQEATIYDGCGSVYFAQFDELNGDYVAPERQQSPVARRPPVRSPANRS